jgi:hypothetical protein
MESTRRDDTQQKETNRNEGKNQVNESTDPAWMNSKEGKQITGGTAHNQQETNQRSEAVEEEVNKNAVVEETPSFEPPTYAEVVAPDARPGP